MIFWWCLLFSSQIHLCSRSFPVALQTQAGPPFPMQGGRPHSPMSRDTRVADSFSQSLCPVHLVCGNLIEDRRGKAGHHMPAGAIQLKNDNLVPSFFQPRAGAIKRLLRADVPKSSEVVAVDPNHAFAPRA